MAVILSITTLLGLAATTDAQTRDRPLSQRLVWLEQRARVHRFGCRHHHVQRSHWHCLALQWTRRELREAKHELWAREWDWTRWLPDKWARIGACETGYGKRPGNWHWNSGRYVSAFGISRRAYSDDARHSGTPDWNDVNPPTPHQQYLAALAHYRWNGGFSGWGCRNA